MTGQQKTVKNQIIKNNEKFSNFLSLALEDNEEPASPQDTLSDENTVEKCPVFLLYVFLLMDVLANICEIITTTIHLPFMITLSSFFNKYLLHI